MALREKETLIYFLIAVKSSNLTSITEKVFKNKNRTINKPGLMVVKLAAPLIILKMMMRYIDSEKGIKGIKRSENP